MNTINSQQLQHVLERHPVQQAYLFGSHARGTAGPLSDIDIAVVYAPGRDIDKAESALFADLSRTLGTDNIDLIDIETASPLLAHRAVLRGVPIIQASPHATAMLKTRILHAYEDTRYLRKIKQQAFL